MTPEKKQAEIERLVKIIDALKDSKGDFLVSFIGKDDTFEQTLPVFAGTNTYESLFAFFTGWAVQKVAMLKKDTEEKKAA